ncbi:unnamed protein product [Porites lobata]|uniref:Uncharacterized protein n=1 Tax=Porites lobata TaxID=104759 RepID=A0ABN8QG40_9CNID|nr:unnamed protein product [Porites lobata]
MDDHCMPRQPLYGRARLPTQAVQGHCERAPSVVRHQAPPKIENAASDRNHWHSWTHTHSTSLEDDCRQRRMAAYELSHKTTSADITTIPVLHLFQTLRFQSGFLEPLENPLRSHNTQSS